jgi:hypothetical protein
MMAIEIRDVQPTELAEAAAFLAAAFGMPEDAPFLNPALMEWKYTLPRSDWKGARSRVVREDGRIVAHAGLWPLRFETPLGPVDAVHLIDWGAAGAAGAGVLLYREMLRDAPVALVLGGAAQARKLLGRMGFSQVGSFDSYARVVRPWRQFRLRPTGSALRDSAKLARNWVWSLMPRAGTGRLEAEPVSEFPAELDDFLPRCLRAGYTCAFRSAEILNFMLLCPGANCRAWLLRNRGAVQGYFLLCRMGGQSRIADLRVCEGASLAEAYSVAIDRAAADPEICEIVAVSSTAWTAEALGRNGFRLRGERPLWLRDPGHRLPAESPLLLQALESDSFFLRDLENPFVT